MRALAGVVARVTDTRWGLRKRSPAHRPAIAFPGYGGHFLANCHANPEASARK